MMRLEPTENRLRLSRVFANSNLKLHYFGYNFDFLGRLPKVDLIILEGENVRPSVRPYVRPSVHKKFLRFQ